MLIFSCHADTGFLSHSLEHLPDGTFYGHLDNFAGVHALMKAFFTGRIVSDDIRIVLTKDEETDMAGARAVMETLSETDVVIVIDVTGAADSADIIFEKCVHPALHAFLNDVLDGLSFRIDSDCRDPIASEDEVDVYVEKCPLTCMLGIRVWGGDYNDGPVYCKSETIETAVEAICRICELFPDFVTDL